MDLRTKFVFSLVAVALASMLALGMLAYRSAEGPLTSRTLRQLNSLAEAKERQLAAVFTGWEESVALVASRTQLRRSLRALDEPGDPIDRERIRTILTDALASSGAIRSLAVYDAAGRLVAAVGGTAPARAEDTGGAAGDGVTFLGLEPMGARAAGARFAAPLLLEGTRVGSLRATLGSEALLDITGDYTGLGMTGEALIVTRDADGQARILNPVRHPRVGERGRPARPRRAEANDPAALALLGEPGPFTIDVIDYRGEPVWAAVRLLSDPDWGLVVKSDVAEELAPLQEFRDRLVRVGLSLSALAILAGVLLGLHFSRPIHDLAVVADRFRAGDLGARADERREDELGVLAGAFNEMGDELERRLEQLEEYKRFFDHSREMLCIAGTDGFFKKVNPAFQRTLGWSEADLVGRPFVDFVHPDDVEKTIAETARLSRGVPTIAFENRYRLPDGTYCRLQWTCHPEPETGHLYAAARLVGSAREG